MASEKCGRSPVPQVGIDAAWAWATKHGLILTGQMNPARPVEAAWEALTDAGYVWLSPEQVEQVREQKSRSRRAFMLADQDPDYSYDTDWEYGYLAAINFVLALLAAPKETSE